MNTDTSTLAEQHAKPSDAEQKVLDALITWHRHGVDLACGFEVAEKLEAIQSRPVALGWVTARLDELKKKGVVDTAAEKRLNPWTGRLCQQWFIPAQQSRLCA
jgi:hypothetical protein